MKRSFGIEVCVCDLDLVDSAILIAKGPEYSVNLGDHIGTINSFYGNKTALQWAYKILQQIQNAVQSAVVDGYQVGVCIQFGACSCRRHS